MLSIFCAGVATALTLVSLASGYYGIAAFNGALVALNVLAVAWPPQRQNSGEER